MQRTSVILQTSEIAERNLVHYSVQLLSVLLYKTSELLLCFYRNKCQKMCEKFTKNCSVAHGLS